ncbi:low temperature requirement protein A [Nocardia yamanashiensis]|uniref:low temperature requirement protein A n=1 Tax=Nocardia yamanashiensis TaxID=209247 RepID=UPI001E411C3D|nr:low temperature requirement protein A [Nocardia yamanashiensis]UGT44115.1 low temperature requirement protein A [Nocardia yamanashiensis]
MSTNSRPADRRGPLRVRMRGRSIDEPHRAATGLELLFDLTFVVAVAGIVAQLGHALGAGHPMPALAPFLQVFFAIWWAWMNFTWFASSYDTDDVPYRLLTLLQMAGVLVLAAGVPAAFEHDDYTAITIGYLVMRSCLVVQWLRAAYGDPAGRRTALRYATGIVVLEALWLVRLALALAGVLPDLASRPVFLMLVAAELAVPVWAEREGGTAWHPHHIAERYTLFTIILLGESVLAVSSGVAEALDGGFHPALVVVALSGLVLLFVLWWLYDLQPGGAGLAERRTWSFLWGYSHYAIFAALAALGAGLEVAVRESDGRGTSVLAGGFAVAIPAAVFLILLWAAHAGLPSVSRLRPRVLCTGAALILLTPLATAGFPVATVATIALVAAGALALALRAPAV